MTLRRRQFITLLGGAAAAWPMAAWAQHTLKVWRIGQVRSGDPQLIGRSAIELEQRLGSLGYVNGNNIVLLNRFIPPRPEATEDTIRELLPNIDLLVIWGTIGGVAAKKLALSVPVVFVSVSAPVDMGLVESLARPGGNMTGITFEAATETYAKRIQILTEIVPTLKRVAVLGAQGDPNLHFAMSSLLKAAALLGLTLIPIVIASPDDLSAAFDEMRRKEADGLISVAGNLTAVMSKRIADLSLTHRLPSCHGFKETVADGGLISLGPDRVWMARQAAGYVDKIMRGAVPADLPVQQPERYEISLNLKTAKALGLDVPATVLARADEVIE